MRNNLIVFIVYIIKNYRNIFLLIIHNNIWSPNFIGWEVECIDVIEFFWIPF